MFNINQKNTIVNVSFFCFDGIEVKQRFSVNRNISLSWLSKLIENYGMENVSHFEKCFFTFLGKEYSLSSSDYPMLITSSEFAGV